MDRVEALRACKARLLEEDGYLGAGMACVEAAFPGRVEGDDLATLVQNATTLWVSNPDRDGAGLKLIRAVGPEWSYLAGRGQLEPDEPLYGVLIFPTIDGAHRLHLGVATQPIGLAEHADSLGTAAVLACIEALIWKLERPQ